MASEDVSMKFEGLKIKESSDINILLLGETGVGKSTFINSIANYLHFKTFKKASKAENLLILIPSMITVTDENFEQVTISIGSDENEYQEIGAAGTQDVKTYVFPIGEGKTRLRLIDSPGMGDPRGIEQDDLNCENILAYLAQLNELHAICFLMKPTTTRKTVLFEYCVKQILSRLEKSASKNIIFIFTNTRGTDYTPGDTLPCLKTVIDGIKNKPPHVTIPLKDNIFSLDNEAFRLLVAQKKGVKFNDGIQEKFIESWNSSAKECWRLISYIVGDAAHDGLKPHQLSNTISINEARKIIVQLSQPLADISQLIHDNIRILGRHQHNLKIENQSLDELKRKLYIPVINLQVTQLTQPATICTSAKCAELVQFGEVQKWHYRQRCHDPCYLTNVTKEIIGDPALIHCAAMNGKTCKKCTCDYLVHMHIYYMTKPVSDKIEDGIVKGNIIQKEQALRESQRLINQIDTRKQELEDERFTIIKSTAQFAHFLQHNAISPFNDSYKAYIEYLIARERSLGRNGDPEVIHNLELLIRQHEELKLAFEKSLQYEKQHGISTAGSSAITPQTILTTIRELYQLKHHGKKIRELLKKQKSSRNFEYDKSCEYIHPQASDFSQSESKKDKKKSSKNTDDEAKRKDKRKQDEKFQNKGPQHRNNSSQSRGRPFNQQQRSQQPFTRREPPPSYEQSTTRPYYQTRDEEPSYEVRVEVKPKKNQNSQSASIPPLLQPYSHQAPGYNYGPPPPQEPYYPSPQGGYYPPTQSQYYPPPQGHYPPPPPSQGHYPPPPTSQGHYPPPPASQGHYPLPPHYHGPPGSFYDPNKAQYHGPPSGRNYGSQPGYHGPPQRHYQQHPGPNQGSQHRRGTGYKPRGNRRGRSQSRSKNSGKSGTEKSSKSSDSDS